MRSFILCSWLKNYKLDRKIPRPNLIDSLFRKIEAWSEGNEEAWSLDYEEALSLGYSDFNTLIDEISLYFSKKKNLKNTRYDGYKSLKDFSCDYSRLLSLKKEYTIYIFEWRDSHGGFGMPYAFRSPHLA